MLISKKILRFTLLINLGISANFRLMWAMEKGNPEFIQLTNFDGQVEEVDDSTNKLCCLMRLCCLSSKDNRIKITKAEKLFADRFIKVIQDIKNFNTLGKAAKKELMEKFLSIVWDLRYEKVFKFIHRDEVFDILELNALNDLIEKNEQNQEVVGHLKWLQNKSEIWGKDKTLGILLDCFFDEYGRLELTDEKEYVRMLQNIHNRSNIGKSSAKALLLACLRACDSSLVQNQDLDSFSITDLEIKWRQLCGNELNNFDKALLALSGSDETGFCHVFSGHFCSAFISGVAGLVAFLFGVLVGLWHGDLDRGADDSIFKTLAIVTTCAVIIAYTLVLSRNYIHYWTTSKI